MGTPSSQRMAQPTLPWRSVSIMGTPVREQHRFEPARYSHGPFWEKDSCKECAEKEERRRSPLSSKQKTKLSIEIFSRC